MSRSPPISWCRSSCMLLVSLQCTRRYVSPSYCLGMSWQLADAALHGRSMRRGARLGRS